MRALRMTCCRRGLSHEAIIPEGYLRTLKDGGNKLAMADVYNSAKKEGLISPETRRGTYQLPRLESVAPNLRNHVHPTLYEYINKNLMSQGQINPEEQEIIRGFRHWWTMMKLNQFVDPFRLGLNNLYQGAHFGSMRSPQTPLYLKKAVTACATHNEDYMTALKHGLMPRPYRLPLNETMARVERIIESETFTKMAMGELKRMVPTAIPEIYRLVHYFAWGVCDHIPRMATYYYLLDKGFSPKRRRERVPSSTATIPAYPATRQKANILFNTPSFGMSMIKVMAQMGMSIPRRIAGDKSDKNLLYLKAFISILAFKLGMQIVMENLGFRTETAGRRYTRDARLPVKMRGAQGTQPREVVYVHADPYNMLERYWDNLKRMGRAGSWVDKVTLAMPFAPHVGIMYIKEWLENRQPSGAKIYSKNDPPLQQAIDATKYLGNRIIRLSEYVSVEPEEKMRREIKETVAEDIGKIAHVLDYIGFFYDRPSKEEQFAGKVRDIEGDIKKDLKYDLKASDEKQRQRVERAKERILEAKVEYDTYGNQDSFIKKVRKTIAELLATLGK